MPNQNPPKVYGVADMHDLASLAHADLTWLYTAIARTHKDVKAIYEKAKNGEQISQYHFLELLTLLEMFEYLADHRREAAEQQAEELEKEWNQIKEGGINE